MSQTLSTTRLVIEMNPEHVPKAKSRRTAYEAGAASAFRKVDRCPYKEPSYIAAWVLGRHDFRAGIVSVREVTIHA